MFLFHFGSSLAHWQLSVVHKCRYLGIVRCFFPLWSFVWLHQVRKLVRRWVSVRSRRLGCTYWQKFPPETRRRSVSYVQNLNKCNSGIPLAEVKSKNDKFAGISAPCCSSWWKTNVPFLKRRAFNINDTIQTLINTISFRLYNISKCL